MLVEHVDRAALPRIHGPSDLSGVMADILPRVSEKLVKGYRFVAEHDAPSRSPLYGELAGGVAEDRELTPG